MNAFVTGSRTYGQPHEGSDLDVVLLVDLKTMQALVEAQPDMDVEPSECVSDDGTTASVSFGRLNLICETNPRAFAAWKDATEEMRGVRHRTGAVFGKDAAAGVIDRHLVAYGLPPRPRPKDVIV